MPDSVGVGPSATTIPVGLHTWTTEHLYIHLSGKVEDLKSSLGDLRTADHIALSAALSAAEKAVSAALASAEKANEKYEREVKDWRNNSNEWRQSMLDREAKFATITTVDARLAGIAAEHAARFNGLLSRLEGLDTKIDDLTRSRDQESGRRTAQVAILGFAFAALTIALRFI